MGFLTFEDCVGLFWSNNKSRYPPEDSIYYNMYFNISQNANSIEDIKKIRATYGYGTLISEELLKKYEIYLYNQQFIGHLKDDTN